MAQPEWSPCVVIADELYFVLWQARRDECRAMALKGKEEGDKVAAVLGMRAIKTCNELIERAKVNDSAMPFVTPGCN